MNRRLLISFSGGETSAYMTWLILTKYRHLYDVIVIVFANTSEENEETLVFVHLCDLLLFRPMGYCVIWLEAVQHHGQKKKADCRIVSFETASRDGSVFEDMIKKYGIPNMKFPHCTRDLKLAPIRAFASLIGWKSHSYDTAIGIRADEIDRMNENAEHERIVYPLIQWDKRTKPQINFWWSLRSFRLRLKGYEGNCKSCWKKTKRKLYTLIRDNPKIFDFNRKMETLYGYVGPEFRKSNEELIKHLQSGYSRTFFRGNKSTNKMFQDYLELRDFVPADDDSIIYDSELDTAGGCGDGESCEVFSDETLDINDD